MITSPNAKFSGTDLSVLNMERTAAGLHIATFLILDRYPDGALLEQRIVDLVRRFPRLRQRLVDGHRPLLVEDADFAAARHVRYRAPLSWAPDSGEEHPNASLRAAVAAAFVEPLDREHPLWRLDVFGYAASAGAPTVSALLLVIHHAFCDGMGIVELTRALREGQPVESEVSTAGGVGAVAGRPVGRDVVRLAQQMTVDLLRPCHSSALTGALGTRREVTTLEVPRDSLRRICRRFDCSLTVALLAVASGALRRHQQAHDRSTNRDLSVFLPLSTRTKAERFALGNYFVTFRVPLGIPFAHPEHRLERCRAEMEHVNALLPLRMSERLGRSTARLPRAWQRRLADLPGRKTNLVFTLMPMNVGGASVAGARILATYPITAPLWMHGASLGFFLDARVVHGLITSDPQIVSDPQQLREAFFDSFSEYLGLLL